MFHSDNSDKLMSAINVSQCSHRSSSANPKQSLKQPSGTSNIQSDSNFGGLKPGDEERKDCVHDFNLCESKKEPKPNNEQLKLRSTKCSSYRGYFFACLSGALYLFSSVIVKYVDDISSAQLTMFRSFGSLVLSLPIVIYSREYPFGTRNVRYLIFICSFISTATLVLRFIALKYLPLGDATIITLSSPALISVLARLFLKEPCGYFQSFTIILTLVGLTLISKVSFIVGETNSNYTTKEYLYGVGGAVGSMILNSFVYICLRKMAANVHPSVIMLNSSVLVITETFVLVSLTDTFTIPTCGLEQWLVILLGVFGFSADYFLTLALKEENVGIVSILRVGVDVVLAFIWQILYFIEIPDKYSISGAILISFAILFINVKKYFST